MTAQRPPPSCLRLHRHPNWRRWSARALLALACLTVGATHAHAGSDAGIRLGLLFNFMKFTEWPNTAFQDDDSPLTICLVRGDRDLEQGISVLDGRVVQGHPVHITTLSRPDQVAPCQVLYLPRSAPATISEFLSATRDRVTLTVSDTPDFVDNGGMIGLMLEAKHYVFEINNESIRQARLRLHPQVLKLAVRVK